jgi:glycerate 2-kinase
MDLPVIKNADVLGTTPLRRDALAILEAGYQAVLTDRVIREEVFIEGDFLSIKGRRVALSDYERVLFIGIGKCAVDAATVFEEILGDYLTDGIVLDVKEGSFARLRSRVGTHPFPSEENIAHTKEILGLLKGVTERDLVLVVVSGGGSALFTLPYGVTYDTLRIIVAALWKGGATINEVNTVRKHLSEVAGGHLARAAFPATVISLIFSDVPGNNMEMIASGPTVRDSTDITDAEAIITHYRVLEETGLPDIAFLETPKEQHYFDRVLNVLLVTNQRALLAMKEKATALGYHAEITYDALEGIASEVGAQFATANVPAHSCFLFGGETTVMIRGDGKGGRNQEFALGAVPTILDGRVIVAASSDGWDNSDVAGALVDAGDRKRALERGITPEQYLNNNDSYHFWSAVGGAIMTGKTGVNVADLYFIIRE